LFVVCGQVIGGRAISNQVIGGRVIDTQVFRDELFSTKNLSTHHPFNPSTHQPINLFKQSTHQPINPSTFRLTSQSAHKPIHSKLSTKNLSTLQLSTKHLT